MNRDSFQKWLQSSKEKLQSRRREKSAKNVSGKQKKELSPRAKTVLTVLGSILAVCLCTVLIVGLTMVIYIATYTYGEPQIDLDEYKANQSQTTIVYAYDKEKKPVELARLHGEENRIWVDAEDMPRDLLDAAVALEDKRFYKHSGVDWYRMASSLFVHGMSQGGSTITQQLIKNLTDNKEVTINRKFNEMLYALNLEKNYEKIDILEAYLNTIYLGEGCYGVQTAAEKYFGKDVSELNAAECATLVSITQFPTKYNPLINPEKNKVRQEYCLKVMHDEKMNMLTDEEYNAAMNYELIFTNSEKYVAKEIDKKNTAKKEDDKIYSYYVEYVIDEVCKDLQAEYGWTSSQAMEKINYGGLQIYTAVDLDVQAAMEDVLANRKTFPKEKDTKEKPAVQAAMTVMTYDGRVAGIVGGAGQKKSNRVLNRAANSPRQPGSSIKPLSIYAPAIEYNQITWSTMIPNAPIYVDGAAWPLNYGQKVGEGELVSVHEALARSLNTIPARILKEMTFDKSFYFLKDKFHFTTLAEFGGRTDRNYSPLATGGMNTGLTTLEMAAAYASFGNGGYYFKPYCYYKVTDSKGEKVLLEHKEDKGERIMAADTADVMCELLQGVVTFESESTKNYAVNGFQTMAKTGTTTDEKDRWFAAGTPYYVSATWYGYDIPREITNVTRNPAGNIFREVFNKIHKNLPAKQFPKSGIAVEKTYCAKTGLLASPNCTETKTGWYRINKIPAECTECANAEVTDVGGQISEAVSGAIGAIGDAISGIVGGNQ